MAIYLGDRVQPGRMMPDFSLSTPEGRQVRISDFRQRANLVIVFSRRPGDAYAIVELLAGLAGDLALESTEVLAVFTGKVPDLPVKGSQMILLEDETGETVDRFLPTGESGAIYILDRYGEIYGVQPFFGMELFAPGEILATVQFIGLQCPE